MAKPTGSSKNKFQKQVWFTDTFHKLNTPRACVILNLHEKLTLAVTTLPSSLHLSLNCF